MKILALESFYGGSHKAFLDGCAKHSNHDWTTLTLSPYKWKWRMRHSAVTFATEVNKLISQGESFDLLFCTDMLPLAEFKGLVDKSVANLPTVIYFHENQLTYPVQVEQERDLHFGITNFVSMISADQVWFNSQFHMNSYYEALEILLQKMPDYHLLDQLQTVKKISIIIPQAINQNNYAKKKFSPPVHIGWVARWEFDKNPEMFFDVLKKLKSKNIPFKLSVIGEQFQNSPEIFAQAKSIFADEIIHWGYIDSYDDYQKALTEIDIIVSTADHEFFGVSIMEAIDAGAYPLLPQKLSYPELLKLNDIHAHSKYFYNSSIVDLELKLIKLVEQFNSDKFSFDLQEIASKYYWSNMGCLIDNQVKTLFNN